MSAADHAGAQALRAAFDRGFALPAEAHAGTATRLLGLRVGGDPFALRVSELAGLTKRRIVPVPSRVPGMAGLVAVRGGLWPVYRLRTLLGYPAGPDGGWLVLVKASTPLALVFDEVERYLEVPADELCALPEPRAHVEVVVKTAAGLRPVIEAASLLTELRRRIGDADPNKE